MKLCLTYRLLKLPPLSSPLSSSFCSINNLHVCIYWSTYLSLCICWHLHGMCVEVRGSCMYRNYFSPSHGFQGFNTGLQAWLQVPIPAEPSCWLYHRLFRSCHPVFISFLFLVVRLNPGMCIHPRQVLYYWTTFLFDHFLWIHGTHTSCFFFHSAFWSQHSIHKIAFWPFQLEECSQHPPCVFIQCNTDSNCWLIYYPFPIQECKLHKQQDVAQCFYFI